MTGEHAVRTPGSPAVALRPACRQPPGEGPRLDSVAVEEPLEIRVDGDPVATTMRTPGDDGRLAVGFLFAEGIIRSLDEVGVVTHCGRPGDPATANVVDVRSAPGVVLDADRLLAGHRWQPASSACGVCGRRSIEDLVARLRTLEAGAAMPATRILACVARLADAQPLHRVTGGLHAAAAFDADGELLACREDVGRHNAVDKTVGELLHRRLLGRAALLAVSGRAGFEIVQKAAVARIAIVASVSAASSLAIDLADRAGVTLAAFARGGSLNVYTHPGRVRG